MIRFYRTNRVIEDSKRIDWQPATLNLCATSDLDILRAIKFLCLTRVIMALGLEPFPMFIDAAPPKSAEYFATSRMTDSLRSLSPLRGAKRVKPRTSTLTKLSNYVHLRYYQYEVTFALYMLTPREKIVFNTILLVILSALLYALYWGLSSFVVASVCRLVYYITGSMSNAPEVCNR